MSPTRFLMATAAISTDTSGLGLSSISGMFGVVAVVGAITAFSETPMGNRIAGLQAAYTLALLAGLNHVCQNTFVHWGSQKLAIAAVVLFFVRCVFVLTLSFGFAKLRSKPVQLIPDGWGLRIRLVARATLGNIVILCLFTALSSIPAPYVAVVYVTKSIWSSIFCYLFLGEELTLRELALMSLGLIAVLLLLYSTTLKEGQVDGMTNPKLGFGFASAAAILGGINSAQVRAMGMKVHYLTNVFALATTGFIFCLPLAIYAPQEYHALFEPSVTTVVLFCSVGLCSFFMQLTMNKAFALTKAGPLVLFLEASTLFAQFLADTLLGYRYGLMAWLSAGAIVLYMSFQFAGSSISGLAASMAWKSKSKVHSEETAEETTSKTPSDIELLTASSVAPVVDGTTGEGGGVAGAQRSQNVAQQ